ncbi:substrate-binding and VWA domain-containing protein [Streptomyces albidoflavus]|uniref:substrate-binding and VWA domain-containing protein n=1 Tax=Streptomyces albidoflavus TaxID=1886 RepID=UPI0038735940|nr:substrate-binding and VWA domain-containing protein [Streptomyces albidoflavus]
MGRHSLPDEYGAAAPDPRPRARGRTVAIATVLVLAVAAGTAVAGRNGLLPLGGSCADEAVRVDVVAAPDIAPALRQAATHIRDKEVTSDGHCMDVRVTPRDAYQVADALRAGKSGEYEVWVPDSALWLDRAGSDSDSTPVTPTGNLAATPVGVAMLPSAARSLGWPSKTYSWAELTAAATSGEKLRLGTADPARSAPGLLALTMVGASAAEAGDKDNTQVAEAAKILASRMSDSDGQVLDTLARDDSGTEQGNPRRNQALILTEQAAHRHNAGTEEEEGLDLFYPKDGTPLLDYPFTLVDERGQTTDESRAAVRFMTFFGEPEGRRVLARHGFRPESGGADEAVVTAAGGRTPQPYEQEEFEPPAPEAVQETLGMWTITVQSARLTTVVDASGSMAQPVPGRDQSRMDVTKASLIQALSQFTPDDEIGLWEFATHLDGDKDFRKLVETRRLGDRDEKGKAHREKLTAAFGDLTPVPDGATGLYDTTLAAYRAAQDSYVSGKFNALVILTDGVNEDPGSISRSSLVAELEGLRDPDRPVPVIAIAVGPAADKEEVKEIAEATGGSGHQVSDPAQIHAVILKAIMEAGSTL